MVEHSLQRGRDSSGLILRAGDRYEIMRADYSITRLARHAGLKNASVFLGHSRLVTNSTADNQPVIRDGVYVIHNGIIVNDESIWNMIEAVP